VSTEHTERRDNALQSAERFVENIAVLLRGELRNKLPILGTMCGYRCFFDGEISVTWFMTSRAYKGITLTVWSNRSYHRISLTRVYLFQKYESTFFSIFLVKNIEQKIKSYVLFVRNFYVLCLRIFAKIYPPKFLYVLIKMQFVLRVELRAQTIQTR